MKPFSFLELIKFILPDTGGRTEKFLFGAIGILFLVLVFNIYANDPNIAIHVASAESQGGDSGKSEDSTTSSASNENAGSEDTDEEDQTSQPKTIKVVKEVIEYKPVIETIVVTEKAYDTDTDGDKLVDALDPDPSVPQSEYFTDDDGDGVPNAIDSYPNEDDFSYYEFETDDNHNGILDSYETS